jgi:aldose 1-epimerase
MNTNAIAIEPMTGVSDSFNNKIGLKELSPGQCYEIEWQVNIKIK